MSTIMSVLRSIGCLCEGVCDDSDQITFIDSLPDHILVKVFSHLSLLELIKNIRLTSCRWRSLSYDFYLWRVVFVRNKERRYPNLRNAILEMSGSIEEFSIEYPSRTYLEMLRSEKCRFTNMKRLRLLDTLPCEHDNKLLSRRKTFQNRTLFDIVDINGIILNDIMHFKDLHHLELRVRLLDNGDFCGAGTMSGFPNLNTLILSGHGFPMCVINGIYKGSPLLKKLTLECDDLTIRAFDDMPGNCNCLGKLSLYLSKYLTEDDLIYVVGNSPNLLSLSFDSYHSNQFAEKSFVFISEACKMLESLKVTVDHLKISDAVVDTLVHNCTNLRKLHFNSKSEDGYANFSAVPEHCWKLEQLVLDLSRCIFTDESLILLSQRATNLSVLHLRDSDCITGRAINQVVINCRRLRYLRASCKNELDLNFDEFHQKNTPLGRKPLSEYNENCLRRDDKMVSLDHQQGDQYHICPVKDDICLERRSIVSNVKMIWLYDTPVTNSSLLQIAKHCPGLVSMGVSKGDIYDDAAEALVKNCLRLRCLHLPGTKLTDAGLRVILTFGFNLLEICIMPPPPFPTTNIYRNNYEKYNLY